MSVNRLDAAPAPVSAGADSGSPAGNPAQAPGTTVFAALLAMMMAPPAVPSPTVPQLSPGEPQGAGVDLQSAAPVMSPVLPSVAAAVTASSGGVPEGTVPQGEVSLLSGSQVPAVRASVLEGTLSQTPSGLTPVQTLPGLPSAAFAEMMPVPAPDANQAPPAGVLSVPQPPFAIRPSDRPEQQPPAAPTGDIIVQAAVARPMAPARAGGQRPDSVGKASAVGHGEPAVILGAVDQRPASIQIQHSSSPDTSLPLPSPVTPDHLMEALARSVVSARPGHYTVNLQLTPEHLGEVRLQIHVAGKEVQAMIQAATPEARQALQTEGDRLRQGLDQAGLNLSGFQVSTGDGGGPKDRERQFQEALLRTDRRRGRSASSAGPVGPAPADVIRGGARPSGGLDTIA